MQRIVGVFDCRIITGNCRCMRSSEFEYRNDFYACPVTLVCTMTGQCSYPVTVVFTMTGQDGYPVAVVFTMTREGDYPVTVVFTMT